MRQDEYIIRENSIETAFFTIEYTEDNSVCIHGKEGVVSEEAIEHYRRYSSVFHRPWSEFRG